LQSILTEKQKGSIVETTPVANASSAKHMISILKYVTALFETAIKSAYPDIADQIPVAVSPAAQEKFGDYQCNSAMTIAQVGKYIADIIICSCSYLPVVDM